MRILIGTLMIFFMYGVSYGETISVKVDSAKLRNAPSISGSIVVLQVPKHYPLTILGDKDEFYQVSDFAGRKGWIHKSTVSKSSGVVVAKNIVNLRGGPGTDHQIVYKAEKGVAFKVVGTDKDWLEVVHESDNKGWIYKSLVWGM